MPRASYERLHNAFFGVSQPLPQHIRRICACQLAVATGLLLFAVRCAVLQLPTLPEPRALVGWMVAYACSVLACARDRGLYVRLMLIWTLLGVIAVLALLRAYARPAARARIGSVGLLVPCALHAVAIGLNGKGMAAVLRGSGRDRRRAGPKAV